MIVLHVWKAINHTLSLAFIYFRYNFLLLTDEYLPHTVLDRKVIDPQATTSSYKYKQEGVGGFVFCVPSNHLDHS